MPRPIASAGVDNRTVAFNEAAKQVVFRFGGGLNSRASEEDIADRECADGQNYDLDFLDKELKPRAAYDLLGTVPNAAEIRGFATLRTASGTVTMLVQAGANVYTWNGTAFALAGTCSATCKLRGRIQHLWQLSDVVLITDLNLVDGVYKWDGSAFSSVTFTDETGSSFGTFKARYCIVSNERAIFANTSDPGGGALAHLIVGCKRGDYTEITVAQRPSSALSDEDPWFLVQPDNRAINGIEEFGGTVVTSSTFGSLYQLTGGGAKDFSMDPLYRDSGAAGAESMAYVGNDIVYGRQGRVESLYSTNKFADVETDDLSATIRDDVISVSGWTTVYNSRLQRVYLFPDSTAACYVMHKALVGSDLSPWSKWTTGHSLAMQPTAVMNCYDPSDGLEKVFMGDASGNLYVLEGTGTSGDAGQAAIRTEFLTKIARLPFDAQAYQLTGWIAYRKGEAFTVTLQFLYGGKQVFNEQISIDISAISGSYFGAAYYGGSAYFGAAFSGRVSRVAFPVPGQSNEFQVRVIVESTKSWTINEIGLRFEAAS